MQLEVSRQREYYTSFKNIFFILQQRKIHNDLAFIIYKPTICNFLYEINVNNIIKNIVSQCHEKPRLIIHSMYHMRRERSDGEIN